MGRAVHHLGLPRRRADALVGQGPGAAARAVRRRGSGGRPAGPRPQGAGHDGPLPRGLRPLLLARGEPDRPEARALPPARQRRSRACRQGSPLAHEDPRPPLRGRRRSPDGDSHHVADLKDEAGRAAAVAWWETLTARGGEAMVVKPQAFVASGHKDLVQPALKCRGPEYLRIIYGPEYTRP